MRIQKLTFKNLNSLEGVWCIHFNDPCFQNGPFVITGPTGAGKTTILDAICLALFGKTPRLKNISKSSGNEVLTHGTQDCFSEIEFESNGHLYRARWEHRRGKVINRTAKKPKKSQDSLKEGKHSLLNSHPDAHSSIISPDGDTSSTHMEPTLGSDRVTEAAPVREILMLDASAAGEENRTPVSNMGSFQDVKRSISELGAGINGEDITLADRIKECDSQIAEILGVKFHQFTRTILLSQGNFNAFLRTDNPGDRASILGAITDTAIYRRISLRVHERYREMKEKCENIEVQMKELSVFSPEERVYKEREREKLISQEKQYQDEIITLEKKLKWCELCERLNLDLKEKEEQEKILSACEAQAVSTLDRLVSAEKARTLDVLFREYTQVHEAVIQRMSEIKELEEKLTRENVQKVKLKSEASEAENKRVQFLADAEKTYTVIKKARTLDTQIQLTENELLIAEKECATSEKRLSLRQEKERGLQDSICRNNAIITRIHVWLDTHPQDAMLQSVLEELGKVLPLWRSAREEIQVGAVKLEDIRKKKEKLEEELAPQKMELEKATQRRINAEESALRVRRIYQESEPILKLALKAAREKLILTEQITHETVTQLRDQLEEGSPCPVCGALAHPFKKAENLPVLQQVRREEKKISDQLSALDEQRERARQMQEKAEKEERSLTEFYQKKQTVLAQIQGQFTSAENMYHDAQAKEKTLWGHILLIFTRNALSAVDPASIEVRIREMQDMAQLWSTYTENREKLRAKLNADRDLLAQLENIDDLVGEVTLRRKTLQEKKELKARLKSERTELFQERVPEEVEKKLEEEKKKLEETSQKIAYEVLSVTQNIQNIENHLKIQREKLKEESEILAHKKGLFFTALKEKGYLEETHWMAARMTDVEYEDARRLSDRLKTDREIFNASLKEKKEVLKIEIEKKITDLTAQELRQLIQNIQEQNKQLHINLGILTSELKRDQEIQDKLANKMQVLHEFQMQLAPWSKLNELIGHNKGEKFYEYAQQITFQHLLRAANPHLEHITHRYTLTSPGNYELSVVDHYRGGCTRSADNLSGGESFMISLALALGLADMNTGKLQLDSLFLDEGFGTLDPNSLDKALNALDELHQTENKLVGIISHIPQLRERISTQISVIPTGPGRSELSGSGCEKIQVHLVRKKKKQDRSENNDSNV